MTGNVKNRYVVLSLGTLVLFFAGVIYAWSILKAPLAEKFLWGASALSFNYTLALCFLCIGGLASGALSGLFSASKRLVAAAVMVFVGFLVSSRLGGGSVALLWLSYGIIASFGIGIIYNTVISRVNSLFPDRRGFASGVMMMGFGASTLVLGSLANSLMADGMLGWRGTYLLLGTLAALSAFGFAMIVPNDEIDRKNTVNEPDLPGEYNVRSMIKRASFWRLFILFTLLSAVGSTALGFSRDYMSSLGAGAGFAALMTGLVSVANGGGRLIAGFLFDKKGAYAVKLAAAIAAIAGTFISLFGALLGSPLFGVIGILLCGVAFGFSPTASSIFVSRFYGGRHFPLNFSVMNLVLIPASFSSTAAGAILSAGGSFAHVFLMLFAFSLGIAFVSRSVREA